MKSSRDSQRIALCRTIITPDDIASVVDVLRRSAIAGYGPEVRRFEHAVAQFVGSDYAVATSSGTAALHLALLAADIGPGDEVVLPALTYVATANVVRYVGATPVFVDVDPDTWNMSPASLVERLTPRTKAIIAVHLYGQPCDMPAITAIAQEQRLIVIEDACEALGASVQDRPVGGLGDIGCFSFSSGKIVTAAGGGMVVTSIKDFARRIRHLSRQAKLPKPGYIHSDVGYNYSLGTLQATLGYSQFRRLGSALSAHTRVAASYDQCKFQTKFI